MGWEKGPRPRGAPARLFAGRRDSRGREIDDHCFSGRVVDSATLVMLRLGFTTEKEILRRERDMKGTDPLAQRISSKSRDERETPACTDHRDEQPVRRDGEWRENWTLAAGGEPFRARAVSISAGARRGAGRWQHTIPARGGCQAARLAQTADDCPLDVVRAQG